MACWSFEFAKEERNRKETVDGRREEEEDWEEWRRRTRNGLKEPGLEFRKKHKHAGVFGISK